MAGRQSRLAGDGGGERRTVPPRTGRAAAAALETRPLALETSTCARPRVRAPTRRRASARAGLRARHAP